EWHREIWRKRRLETEAKTTFQSDEGLSKETRVCRVSLGEKRRIEKEERTAETTRSMRRDPRGLNMGKGKVEILDERVCDPSPRERGVDNVLGLRPAAPLLPPFPLALPYGYRALPSPSSTPLHPGTPSTKYIFVWTDT
ncbi:hypothetical protein CSPX01_07360, partial [Colletotrichum filicis]